MTERLRVVVTGLAATYPFGGVFWDYAQYALGFHRLGHDVLYLEDTGKWCYDPANKTFIEDGTRNARTLAADIGRLEPALAKKWFYRDTLGNCYGRTWSEAADFCRSADLFIHLSANCMMRDEYFAAERVVFIDSDPLYTPATIPGFLSAPERSKHLGWLRQHDAFFTFGESVGAPDCRISTEHFDWMPTRQPVVLDCFDRVRVPLLRRRPVFTTVASWEPTEDGPVIDGVQYGGKSVEFRRFMDVAALAGGGLELAISGPHPRAELRAAGWIQREGFPVSRDPWVYRDYLARSSGEWSVAKNAYAAGRTGWFSCRTACYLALGVPAVVQETGFSGHIPTGEGLFAFDDSAGAAAAIGEVRSDPRRHAGAALELAREHLDSDRVLSSLIERSFCATRGARTKAGVT